MFVSHQPAARSRWPATRSRWPSVAFYLASPYWSAFPLICGVGSFPPTAPSPSSAPVPTTRRLSGHKHMGAGWRAAEARGFGSKRVGLAGPPRPPGLWGTRRPTMVEKSHCSAFQEVSGPAETAEAGARSRSSLFKLSKGEPEALGRVRV